MIIHCPVVPTTFGATIEASVGVAVGVAVAGVDGIDGVDDGVVTIQDGIGVALLAPLTFSRPCLIAYARFGNSFPILSPVQPEV